MRNLLLASLLLFAACSDSPVQNQIDSPAVDSAAMMQDTTLPHPKSTTLDSVPVDAKSALKKQDSLKIAQAMKENTPTGWEIMDTLGGDLNRDQYRDLLIVLKSEFDSDIDSMPPRPLLILTGNPDGTLTFEARNDNVVLCYNCGGIFGDPYDGLAIKNGYFSTQAYGGSSWRWSKITTFKYNEKEKTWLLHRDGGVNYNIFEEEHSPKETLENQEYYGKLTFTDYNLN